MKTYRATAKLIGAILEQNEFLLNAPKYISHGTPYYECLIGIGKDHTMSIYVDQDTIISNPNYFEEVKE